MIEKNSAYAMSAHHVVEGPPPGFGEEIKRIAIRKKVLAEKWEHFEKVQKI